MHRSQQVPIFLINLDRSADRLSVFQSQMRRLGLTFERVSGVDGNLISSEEKESLKRNSSQTLLWGESAMGCFLSHRAVWKLVSERNLDWAFIAEDDLCIAKTDPFFQNTDWIPRDAHVVKAETFRQRVRASEQCGNKVSGSILRKLETVHFGCAGYFISAACAEYLLEATKTKCDPVDHIMFDPFLKVSTGIALYQLDPAICIQNHLLIGQQRKFELGSAIEGERVSAPRPQKLPPKPKGLKKWKGKTYRRLTKIVLPIADMLENFRKESVVKKIPFAGDLR